MEIRSRTPVVPALARGLSAMRLLSEEGPLAMEALASRLSLPRSSAFRILETLRSLGYAERDPARRYRLVWNFSPGERASVAFAARLVARMEQLADALNVTIEWYEPCADGIELRQQRMAPRAEVQVWARPGFVRRWNTELDAIGRLAHALVPSAPTLKPGVFAYKRNGRTSKIPVREARIWIAAARKAGTASDAVFNANGIRRSAAAVLFPGGALAGFLVTASSISFDPKSPTPARLVAALREACSHLSH